MNASIGYLEIKKFKARKYKVYCGVLKEFCQYHAPVFLKVTLALEQ